MTGAVPRAMRFSSGLLLPVSLLAGCVCGGPHGDDAQDDPSCGRPSSFAEPAREQGRVYLDGIDDGALVEMTRGPQGGCMVTPTVCVEGSWVQDQPADCLILSIANDVVGSADPAQTPVVSEGSETLNRFSARPNGTWCAASVWNYLDDCSSDLDGTALRMQLEVRGADGSFARGSTSVILQAPDGPEPRSSSPSPWG